MTIRLRFLLWYLCILVPLLLIFGYLEQRRLESFYLSVTASRLQNEARAVLASQSVPPEFRRNPRANAERLVQAMEPSGADLLIFGPEGRLIAASESLGEGVAERLSPPDLQTLRLDETPNYEIITTSGNRQLVLWLPLMRPGRGGGPRPDFRPPDEGVFRPGPSPNGPGQPPNGPGDPFREPPFDGPLREPPFDGPPRGGPPRSGWVALVTPLTVLDATIRENTAQWIGRMALALGIAAAALWGLLQAVLAPLDRMAQTADRIGKGDRSLRMGSVTGSSGRDEMSRLALAFDRMLDSVISSEAEMRRFLAEASHELRTPLTVIGGYVDVLRRGAGDRPEERRRAFGAIREEVDRMSRLVSELLALARLQGVLEKEELRSEPVRLLPLLEGLIEEAELRAPERPITLHAGDGSEEWRVQGDPDRIRQAVRNLMDNVLAHTPPTGRLTVSLHRMGESEAVIEVADDGPPIPPELLPNIFGRFVKGRGSSGSGLGLSIVKAVAEAHGGWTKVETSEEGNRFLLGLPLLERVSEPATKFIKNSF